MIYKKMSMAIKEFTFTVRYDSFKTIQCLIYLHFNVLIMILINKRNRLVINKDVKIMSYSVYKHTFPNGKVYIGITSLNPEKRWKNGKGYTKKNKNGEYRQQLMARAVLKYGWDNIEHEILFNNLTKECAEQKEIDLISYYQSNKQDFGYNISNGGNTTGTVSESTKQKLRDINLGKKHSKETRNKISIIGKGRCVSQQTKKKISKSLMGHYVSTETRKKLSEANKGEKNPNYGKHLSTETRKKLSESHKGEKHHYYGKHLSDEHKRNLSQSLKGRVLSEEHRRKIGEASKKRMQSKNERYKLAKSRMKPVLCIETNIIYQSITEANKLIGTSTSILRCLRGEYKTSGGYHWKYLYDQTKRDGTIIQGVISLGLITEEEALRQLKGQSKKGEI